MGRFSAAGVTTLEDVEGCRLEAYQCEAGYWTIGIGHRKGVKKGDKITRVQALQFLYQDIADAETTVNKYCPKVKQVQYDALVIFCFNVGSGAFEESTLLKKVQINPNDPTIRDEFMRWNKVDASCDGKDNDNDGVVDEKGEKKVSPGLINREKRTADLYFS